MIWFKAALPADLLDHCSEVTTVKEKTGRCLCGAVSFRLVAEPLATRVCWCRDCQHLAANGTVNMLVPADGVIVTGALAEYTRRADSGNEVTRQFCPSCGSQLFARSSARPQLRVVRIGCLDDPSSVRPTMNIWAASAPAWACLDPELERVDHQPTAPGSQQAGKNRPA